MGRIQRFDTDGNYQGEFSVSGNVQGLAIGPDGNLYAIIAGKVRKYSQSGILLPIAFEVSAATAVAVDSTGSVFVFKGGTKPICELAPGGGLVECFGEGFNASTGLAANLCPGSQAPGNLYAVNLSIPNAFVRAYGGKPVGCFRASTGEADPIGETTATLNGSVNPKGEAVSECFFEYGVSTAYGQSVSCDPSAGEIGTGTEPVPVQAEIGGLLKGTVHHFRLVARVGGELEKGVDATFKTLGPPVISEERATGATDTQATLKALVNPEGLLTSYRFEYGPTELYGQSTEEVPIGSERANKAAQTVLEGLDPGTTYHWRIVAINSSDESQGDDHLVRTYRPFARATDCLSRALRTGRSASLPDCRAYEMVSPVDKNGGNIVSGLVASDDPGGYMRAAPNGSKVTYTSTASFADQPNAFGVNQYLSTRGGDGWSTHGIHQPVKGDPGEAGLSREFMIFSEDLCSAWLIDHQTPPPSVQPAGQDGFPNLFRRDNCAPGAGLLEALVPEPPVLLAGTATTYVDQYSVQGISDDGRHALFVAKAKLPHVPKAATGSNGQIYDRFEGGLSLVSVLPSGAPNANHSVV
ncbi:MAG TPA: hypothetical protein VFM94_01090, partial [Solirubrobacterales bacterium]|nr:hypothetical protein [Solirubrobacterales bacterium]